MAHEHYQLHGLTLTIQLGLDMTHYAKVDGSHQGDANVA
jgi:hypothetical protein